MEIPLNYLDVYEDSVRRHHLTSMIDVTKSVTEETSRGSVTRETLVERGYLEIERGRAYIELTSKNAPIIAKLAKSSLFEYADEGHAKLVEALLPEKDYVEAEVVEPEAERVAIPVIESEVADEETLTEEDLMSKSMPDLKRLAKEKGVKALPSDKKEALVAKIIEG